MTLPETCLFEWDHRAWTVCFQMQATLTPIPGFTLWSFLDLATRQCHLEWSPWCQMMGVHLTRLVERDFMRDQWDQCISPPKKFCTLLNWESSRTFQFSSKQIFGWGFSLPCHGRSRVLQHYGIAMQSQWCQIGDPLLYCILNIKCLDRTGFLLVISLPIIFYIHNELWYCIIISATSTAILMFLEQVGQLMLRTYDTIMIWLPQPVTALADARQLMEGWVSQWVSPQIGKPMASPSSPSQNDIGKNVT